MGLFDSKSEKQESVKRIRPTVLRTENVAKELLRIAKNNDIEVSSLDFNLLEVQTMVNRNQDEFEEIVPEEIQDLSEQDFLDENFEIKQIYEIEVFSKEENDPYKDFHTAIGANATKCKIYLSIKEGAKVSYTPSFEKDLYRLINKGKVRAGILVYLFDEMLENVVSKISAHVRIEESVEYAESSTILVAQGYEPTATRNDAFILHYEKREELDENAKVNYASRGFLHTVQKNEILMEYQKPFKGDPGRDCRGLYISPKEPLIQHEPNFSVDDTIEVEETDTSIFYRAKENGYIAFEENKYIIKTDVDIDEISFKKTGSIESGVDSDVSISVSEADAVKDAIGAGMRVEVTEINIQGNVGPKAVVKAKKASIGGQTHKDSSIQADELNINVHKGLAKGSNIKITRLEHGKVNGENITISQAMGGVVNAREVMINICSSYVKVTASKKIVIEKLQGSENIFTIDPLLQDVEVNFQKNKDQIKDLEKDLSTLEDEVKKYQSLVRKNTPAFNDVKKRLMHYKKNGVKMPESFVKQYKQFQKISEHLKSLESEQAQKSDQLTLLTTRRASFQDNIFDARIINRGTWTGHNTLKIKLVEPPIEVSFNPPEGCADKVFGLAELDDGHYVIKAVKE